MVERLRRFVAAELGAIARIRAIDAHEQRIEIEIVQVLAAAADLFDQIGAPDNVFQAPKADHGEDFAHFLGDEAHQVHHLVGGAGELLAQRFVLRADADGAGVGMALAHHETAHGDKRSGADAEFFRAEDSRDDNVTACADAAIGAQAHAVTQVVEHQGLMRFGEAHFPRNAGVLDRCLRTRAGAADMAGDENCVRTRFRDAGGDRADAGLRNELHADARDRIDLLQIVDELREVFDRIDVMVRRRADERDARCRVTQARDEFGNLEARQLAAFPGLGALRDLDFDFAALVQIFRRHAEAARGDLFHRRVGVVAVRQRLVAFGVFAALAAHAARADAIHRNVERAVRFR